MQASASALAVSGVGYNLSLLTYVRLCAFMCEHLRAQSFGTYY